MKDENKPRAGRVLRFAVSGALLVSGPIACGGAEPVHTNEPMHVNEPPEETPPEETPTGDGTGETSNEPAIEAPDEPRTNEPFPG